MNATEHQRERAAYVEWCTDHASAIEAMAEALADEQGLHLHLLNPDSRAFIMALATRAVREARTFYIDPVGPDLLEDAERRIDAAEHDLRQLLDQLPLPADRLANTIEHIIETLTIDDVADNS